MEIGGLPLHPLIVHATVVVVPLAAVSAVLLGLVPGWRWLTRWPAAVLAVVGLALAWLAKLSGAALLASRPELGQLVERHEELGELLAYAMVPFAAVVVLAAWSLAGTTALASGRGAWECRLPALAKGLPVLLVLAGAGVLVLVVLTGESGARAVWGQ
jgi:uncharacterized membrane protein